MILNSPYITGSLTVTGDATIAGNITVTGSLSGTAATASFALTLGGTGSVGFATTGAFSETSGSASSRLTQIEQVYATTGSNSFRATQSITGSLTVTGQIIAQTLNVQQVTSSIVFSSGSNTFGCDLNSRQTFTGSFYQTGSIAYFGGNVGIGTTATDCYIGYSVLQAQGNSGAIIQTSDGSVKTALVSNSTGFGIVGTRTNHGLKIYTNDIERLHITDTGVSTFKCQVCAGSVTACGIITANNSGAAGSVLASVMSYADGYRATLRLNNTHTGGNIWELYSTNSSDGVYGGGKLGFRNTTTDNYAMTITCAGNVGIGTSNPTGAAGLTLAINGGSSQTRIALKNSTTADNAGSGFQIGLSGLSAFIEQRENDILTLSTSAIERMRITGTGITSFTCQVCATSGVRFGNGSSTINYYCSADWAPQFYAGGSTSFGLSSQTGTGKFTRIGNVVILHGQIAWTGAGSGGASLLSIQNLPFPAVSSARGGVSSGIISGISQIASGGLNLIVEISSCIIYFTTNCGNGGPHIHLTGDAVTSGGSRLFSFGGSYITNDAS
jgi:hypothetical protein